MDLRRPLGSLPILAVYSLASDDNSCMKYHACYVSTKSLHSSKGDRAETKKTRNNYNKPGEQNNFNEEHHRLYIYLWQWPGSTDHKQSTSMSHH